jgi:hypothetical protein
MKIICSILFCIALQSAKAQNVIKLQFMGDSGVTNNIKEAIGFCYKKISKDFSKARL